MKNRFKKIMVAALSLSVFVQFGNVWAYSSSSYEANLSRLEGLIDQCNAQNIPIEYEQLAYNILLDAKTYLDQNMPVGETVTYTQKNETYLNNLYLETKESLEDYLSGDKNPKYVPENPAYNNRQVSGKFLTDSRGRKIFSNGYVVYTSGFSEPVAALGMDNISIEVGPEHVIRETDVCNWKLVPGENGEVSITENGLNGNGLKIVNNSSTPCSFEQELLVDRNKTYIVTAYAKADKATMMWFGTSDQRKTVRTDWQQYSWTISTGAKEDFYDICFGISAATTGLYFDDITVTEVGGDENIVLNGDFSLGAGYRFKRYDFLDRYLTAAAENNLSCHVLIQPAYMPDFIKEIYASAFAIDTTNARNNFGFIINDENILRLCSQVYKYVSHQIRNYPALTSIILANEPRFEAFCAPSVYNTKFRRWLKDKYGSDISNLNSAYGTSYSGFSSISLPTSFDYTTRTFTAVDYDYLCFNEDMVTDFFSAVYSAVKSEGNIPVSIKVETNFVFDNIATTMKQLRHCANVEKLNPYFDIAGCDNYCTYDRPRKRSNDMAWYDMLSSLTGKPIYNSEEHTIPDEDIYFGEKQAKYTRFDLWQGALHGKVISSIWQYSTKYQRAGFLCRPDCLYEAGRTSLDLRKNADIVGQFISKDADIAILYSKPSRLYDSTNYIEALEQAYNYAISTGHKVGFVTDEHIENLSGYEYLIIPNVSYIVDTAVVEIKKFAQNGGTVVSFGTCFTGNQYKQASMPGLSTIRSQGLITELSAASKIPANIYKKFGEDVTLISNGSKVTNVDWQYVRKGQKIYIALCYLGNNDTKNISVKYGTKTSASVTAEDSVPMLICVDTDSDTLYDVFTAPDEEVFEILSLTNDGDLTVKSKCTSERNATVAMLLRDSNGVLKAVIANTRNYQPMETKTLNMDFGSISEGDEISVEIWDNYEDRNLLEVIDLRE